MLVAHTLSLIENTYAYECYFIKLKTLIRHVKQLVFTSYWNVLVFLCIFQNQMKLQFKKRYQNFFFLIRNDNCNF